MKMKMLYQISQWSQFHNLSTFYKIPQFVEEVSTNF